MKLSSRSRASRCRLVQQVASGRYVGATHTPEQQARQATEVAYDSPDRPDSYVGPVQVVIIEGRGRGLVVTEDAPAGTLLLLCHPLSVLTGPAGIPLAPSELVSHFEQSSHTSLTAQQQSHQQQQQQQQQGTWVSAEQSSILDSLFDGSSSSAAASPLPLEQLASVRLEPSLAAASHALQATGDRHKLAAGRLQRIMEFNCKGEDNGDPAAWLCRGEPQSAYIGLFPALALINHSCSPNASCCGLAGGAALAVRSSVDLARGDEIQISYLGRYISSPASTRRELLHHSYGFTCDCGRCTAEDKRSPLSDQGLHGECARLDPFLRQAVMEGLSKGADPRPLRDLESRLLRFSLSARAAVAGLGVASGLIVLGAPDSLNVGSELQLGLTGTFVGALALDEPELATLLIQKESSILNKPIIISSSSSSSSGSSIDTIGMDDTSGQGSIIASIPLSKGSDIIRADAYRAPVVLASLGLLLLMAAPPGSYSHCALCMTHLSLLQASLGAGHPLAQHALTVAIDAHVARYGETAAAVRARLMEAHEVAQQGLDGVISLGK